MGNSYLAVGYECNHKCLCCPLTTYDRLHSRMELDDIKKRVDLIPVSEENHIVLSGGEPMLHPNFLDILDYLTEKSFTITVLSNASMCKDAAFAERLNGYDHLEIITAIHSSTPMIHDEMTGIRGSLLETLEGLDHLVQNRVGVTIKHIFNARTLPLLIDTFDYLEKHFPPQVGFQFCTMDYSGRAGKNKDILFASREEVKNGLQSVLDLLEARRSKPRRITVIETPYCYADPYYWRYFEGVRGRLSTYIAPNTEAVEAVYEVNSQCHSDYQPCQSCAVKKYCPGIWQSAYEIDNAMVEPIVSYD